MEQLFLIEILVEKVGFSNPQASIPRNHIRFNVTFGNVFNLEIRPDPLTGAAEAAAPGYGERGEIIFDSGRSYLFSCQPSNLAQTFKRFPLEVAMMSKDGPGPVATVRIDWPQDFHEILQMACNGEETTEPAILEGTYTLEGASKDKLCKIQLVARLNWFGSNITTQFQVLRDGSSRKFLFRSAAATSTFQCQRFGAGTFSDEIVPVGHLYNMLDLEAQREGSFDQVYMQYASAPPSAFNIPAVAGGVSYPVPSDMLSILIRPEENRFTNLKEIRKAKDSREDLTAEKINRMLCKNPDCPAVQKFKDLGIGPLAKSKGLGSVKEPVDISLDYGLSQTYGTMDNYGPYGFYRKPKRLDQPFMGKPTSLSDLPTCECGKHKEKSCTRETCEPLRLTGGSPTGGDQFPAPMAECKDLMDNFDKLLADFKHAIGPCGQAVCPYAGNVIEEACKRMCKSGMGMGVLPDPYDFTPTRMDEDRVSACGMPGCPHERDAYMPVEDLFKRNQMKNACGSPHCPFTKKKMGQDADEIDMLKTCGAPKCKNKLGPDPSPLDPIHWDCPDPLPKGPCKNIDCPHQPKDLAAMRPKKGPCGSEDCPYAAPPWCGGPECPFGPPRPCPFSPPSPQVCDNKNCPFQTQQQESSSDDDDDYCDNPDCPYAPKRDKTCDNPDCPFAAQQEDEDDEDEVCDNPECPYRPKMSDICDNPECPFADKKPSEDTSICSNPNCPYAQKPAPSCYPPPCGPPPCPPPSCWPPPPCGPPPCPPPPCPFLQEQGDEICNDPYCPYNIPVCPRSPCMPPPCPYSPCPYALPPCPPFEPITLSCTPDTCKNKGGSPEQEKDLGDEPTVFVSYNRNDDLKECTVTTCVSKGGGNLVCGDCGQAGSKSAPNLGEKGGAKVQRTSQSEKALGKKGKGPKGKGKYVYSIGDKYPGVNIGHRECIMPGFKIPANMGWLWNVFTPCMSLKPRRGWRPGALGRTIAARIRKHRRMKGLQMSPDLVAGPGKRRGLDSDSDVTVAPKPTLHIQKKDGVYMITMNPLKDPKTLEDNENPYMDCTPLQFKIIKNKNKVKVKREGEEDYKTCFCGDEEEEEVEEEEESESSSSDSELDIEFTPPAGIIRPQRLKKKKNVVHTDTQYDPKDIAKDKLQLKGGKGKGKGKGGKGKGKGKGKKKK